MKSFKQHLITEKEIQIDVLTSMIKSGRFAGSSELENYVKTRMNATKMGEGNFSVVLSSGSEVEFVMKIPVLRTQYNSWFKFAEMAMKNHSSNSLFPRVKMLHDFGNDDYVGFIESLRIYPQAFTDLADKILVKNRVPHVKDQFFHMMSYVKRDALKEGKHGSVTQSFLEYFRIDFAQVQDFYRKIDRIQDAHDDMHAGNVGLRKNNELVFFDPIV